MTPENPQLNCLVMAQDPANHTLVSSWLGVSRRVSSVTAAADEESLTKYLGNATCHLCILLVKNTDQPLPASTLKYPNMRVLVMTIDLTAKSPEILYQQGATDVVNLHEPLLAQHAISRLIDECVQGARMQHLQSLNAELLKRNKRLVSKMASMEIAIDKRANEPPTDASNDNVHSACSLSPAEPVPAITNIIKSDIRDTGPDLPSRKTVMQRFSHMLHSDVKAPRFTALLVSILADEKITTPSTTGKSRKEKNVQDLTLYRAAGALQNCVSKSTIFGRVNQNALLLIQPSDVEPVSRDAANRVRKSLGTLGGLINSESDVHINTMNLPSTTNISADEVVERLETLAT